MIWFLPEAILYVRSDKSKLYCPSSLRIGRENTSLSSDLTKSLNLSFGPSVATMISIPAL